jgi:hypothetical protein
MNCSIRILTIFLFVLTATLVSAQTKISSTEANIAAIRASYSKTNSLPLKRQTFNFEAAGCVEDGIINYFQYNNDVLKITESGSIGDGSWTTEYYYNLGKLIFCYDKIVGGAAAEKAVTTEYRFYLKNDKPIRCMENKKIIAPDSKATDKIKTTYKLLKAHKTRNFAAALCDG